MLVAPREPSLALSRHVASHDAASLELHPAPSSTNTDMAAAIPSTEAAASTVPADAPSAPAPAEMATDPLLVPLPDLPNNNNNINTKEPALEAHPLPLDGPLPIADLPLPLDPSSIPITATSAADGMPMMAPVMPVLDAPIVFPENMPMPPDLSMMPDMDMDMSAFVPPQGEQRLSAFARLRFDDGSYYMHTYQIVLGRNVQLAHKDMRRFARADQLKAKGEPQRAEALLNGKRRKQTRDGPKSVISEAGGIVNAPIKMMPAEYRQRRQSVASQAPSGGSHPPNEGSREELEQVPQNVIMQAFPEAPDTFDSYVPEDPNDCPLVPIHPQHITDRTGAHGPKGISRQHAKIFYDFDNGNFRLLVLGTNGLHHEGRFMGKGEEVELSHGDTILIGMVEMTFFLPDIALTEEQRNREQGSGSQSRPMSFSFENGQGESEDMDDSASEGEMSINPRHVYHQPHLMFDSDEEGVGDDDDVDDLDDDEDQYSPVPRPKPSLKIKLKARKPVPPLKPVKLSKSSKSAHKRKHERERSPEEPLPKKIKVKTKESHKEQASHDREKEKDKEKEKEKEKEKTKATKIPSKAPAKIPSKIPSKAPAKSTKQPKEEGPKAATPPPENLEQTPSIKPESPLATRTPELPKLDLEGGDLEGIITAEIARRHNLPEALIGQPLEKRKGPGRPPKDGVMSKRQRSQLVKRGKEIERAQAAGIDPADLPQPVSKPKPPRRKESNADDDDVRETTERTDASGTPGDKKPPKLSKPARTPSPEMRIEDFTEEQLARPTSNYVVLIHEAISSSASGQMNLQQIYNYIEKTYPWYKFKTTTSGWQSSVRHNLGQHDAFVKGDKEGKGYMWRINPNVSIEKERRKRQVSPPQVNHAQRQGYYHPPPNAYPHYGQPGYYPGMPPHGMPPAGPPRPPPNEPPQPRLPPSMARNVGSSAATAAPTGPAPSPYASPWAGGNTAGTPPMHNHPRPYHPPNSQTHSGPSASHPSGQYGVLYPTTAPPASYGSQGTSGAYGNHYATAGPSPYGPPPNRPYMPYPPQQSGPAAPSPPVPNASNRPAPNPQAHTQSQTPHHDNSGIPHPSGRYPVSTDPELIRQLEAFRTVYLQTRIEPGEDLKVNNAIRACVTPELTACLTLPEQNLLKSIKTIPKLKELMGHKEDPAPGKETDAKPVNGTAASGPSTTKPEEAAPSATVAAIAAVAAANTVPNTTPPSTAAPSEPHKFTPNMTPQTSSLPTGPVQPPASSAITTVASAVGPARVQAQRPSVEPLTPVPGSPAVQATPQTKTPAPGTPMPIAEDAASGAQEAAKVETDAKPPATSEADATVKQE
ncbi:hypothetical protein DM02DRAFT_617583 [Periconia macrospinosa]|uniref:Fork-head domain-containing protein n=1 Tax=Periconia macrospinosa TaxID=97972 RepID=A0A2V1DD46_9PLEO|nr:hypothetical protein DM02DRAFT_617583 [Periconia macrospinosa]